MSINDNKALYKEANQDVMFTKQSVAIARKVPTLTVNMTAEIAVRNEVHKEMNAFLNAVITQPCGTDGWEYWPSNIKYNPILMQSIANESTYNSIKQYINVNKRFIDKNKVFPVYLTSSLEYVFLSTFRYKVPGDVIFEADNDHILGYYEAQALYEGNLVNYTISIDFRGTLDDVNLNELHKNKSKWSGIRFGDKNKHRSMTMIQTKDISNISNVNHFTHKNILYITCMLLSVASAMWAMDLLEEAISFFQEFQSTLNTDDKCLWKNLHAQSGKAFPNFKFQKTLTPGGIRAENEIEMNDDWAFVL